MKKINFDPTKSVLTITVGFLVIYFFTMWQWALITSLVVGVIGVLSEKLSGLINEIWMKLTLLLSYIVPNILLAVIYYLILVPFAFISRIFTGADHLILKSDSKTTFFDINREVKKSDLEKMW